MNTMYGHSRHTRGFIALTSSLILSAILVLLVITTSTSSFYARSDSLVSEYKRTSLGLAEACSNAALLKIARDYDYANTITADPDYVPGKGVAINLSGDTCYIQSVTCVNTPCEDATHRKALAVRSIAQYPSVNGSWSTTEVRVVVQNPTYSTIPPPTCSFIASPTSIDSGEQVGLAWNTNGNATGFTVIRDMNGTQTTIYSGAITGSPITDTPAQSATYTATITGPGGSTQCVSPQSVTVQPSFSTCAETLMMVAGSMNTGDLANEGIAAKALLDLYGGVSPVPFAGIGSYGGLDGTPGSVPDGSVFSLFEKGWLTDVYGGSGSVSDSGAKFPAASTNPSQWTSPDSAFTNDATFATDSVSGHQQGYKNFGLTVPAGATVNGIEVVINAKLAGSPPSQTTATLYPSAQGYYGAWTNGVSTINETGSPNCSNGGSVITGTTGNRESVTIDLSSVPDGATITSVDVLSYDRGDSAAGGTYKTFVRLNAVDADAGANLATTLAGGGSSCSGPKTQNIDVPDTVKSGSTVLDIGALKTAVNTSAVRVGALRAVINYTPAPLGTISLALSKNDGTAWLSGGKTTATFGPAESLQALGTNADLWGQGWIPSDFQDGNFALRLTNNAGSGVAMMVNYATVRIFYTVPTSGLYGAIEKIVTTINSSGGTDIGAAIAAGSAELSGPRHHDGYSQVLILVSPSGNHASDLSAAFPASDNAKLLGIQLFTINFGTGSANDDWALLSNGTVPNPGHQPGSQNDVANATNQAAADIENADDDNFFISPDSAAMKGIFETIGKKVCPILTPPPPPAPPPPPPPAPPLDPISVGSWDEIIQVGP